MQMLTEKSRIKQKHQKLCVYITLTARILFRRDSGTSNINDSKYKEKNISQIIKREDINLFHLKIFSFS